MKVTSSEFNLAQVNISDSFGHDILMPPGATLEQASDFINRVKSVSLTPMDAVKTIYEDVFAETLEYEAAPNVADQMAEAGALT